MKTKKMIESFYLLSHKRRNIISNAIYKMRTKKYKVRIHLNKFFLKHISYQSVDIRIDKVSTNRNAI